MGLSRSPGSKSVEHESLQGPYRQWAPRKMRSERRRREGGGGVWSGRQMDGIKKDKPDKLSCAGAVHSGCLCKFCWPDGTKGKESQRVLASALKVFFACV